MEQKEQTKHNKEVGKKKYVEDETPLEKKQKAAISLLLMD